MSVKDSFAETGMIVKVAFFIGFVANFCNWIAFTCTGWIVTDTGGAETHYGLWRKCNEGTGATGWSTNCQQTDGTASTEFGVVQAFAIFGFITLNVAFFLIVLFMFWGRCKQDAEAGLASGILFIISTVMWLIAVIVFGADIYDDMDSSVYDLHYAFALAVCALILALITGILMIAGSRGNAVGSK